MLPMTSDFSEIPKPRNISNSEVSTFLSCERQYEYAFMEELAPIKTPDPLARGSVGHNALELYCRALMNGADHDQALKEADEAYLHPVEDISIDVLMNTQFIVTRFLTAHAGFPNWEILGVEEQVDLPLTSQINMTIRYDLYFRNRKTDKYGILDWKFAYDFWRDDDHDINAQMPKYIAVLQANDIRCDEGILAEIRTRKLGAEKTRDHKNLWRLTTYRPSYARKQSMLRQHVAASLRIEEFRALPKEERKLRALPVLNKYGPCKYCNFVSLCNAENDGKKDLSVDIRTHYKPSTYGYNKDKDATNALDF